MKKIPLIIVLAMLIVIGSQTAGFTALLDSHADQGIKLAVDKKSNGILSFVSIKHKEMADEKFLSVSGKINKPQGKRLSRARVVASFLNTEGQVIIEDIANIRIRRTRLVRGTTGTFFMTVADDPEIVKCKIRVEWTGVSNFDENQFSTIVLTKKVH